MRKKLEKVGKPNTNDLNKCMQQLETEIESGSLLTALRSNSKQPTTTTATPIVAASTSSSRPDGAATGFSMSGLDGGQTQQQTATTSSTTPTDDTEPGVLRRFPSLTWRQANERARILFYKGRTPSIHYNEKRDSFRVSMLAEVIKDGQHKIAEVPVTDDDVRRLLNSFGLYWDGESISLLAKSDEIFTSAQQAAFDFILSGAAEAEAEAAAKSTTAETTPVTSTEEAVPTEEAAKTIDEKSNEDDENTVKLTLIA